MRKRRHIETVRLRIELEGIVAVGWIFSPHRRGKLAEEAGHHMLKDASSNQAVAIADSIWKPLRSRVQQDSHRLESRRCQNDKRRSERRDSPACRAHSSYSGYRIGR